ncbi:hypothetical protein D3C72_2301230 [compost metagenome]
MACLLAQFRHRLLHLGHQGLALRLLAVQLCELGDIAFHVLQHLAALHAEIDRGRNLVQHLELGGGTATHNDQIRLDLAQRFVVRFKQ